MAAIRMMNTLPLLLFGGIILSIVENSDEAIPLGLLQRLQNLTSEQFLSQYVHRRPMGEGDGPAGPGDMELPGGIESPDGTNQISFDTETGSLTSDSVDTVAASVGEPTQCQPEEASVPLAVTPNPDILYWPTCTRTPRCSGCCNSELQECSPTEVKIDEIQALRLRYQPGMDDFVLEAFETKFVEHHLRCNCRCRVQPHHCDLRRHVYLENSCRCKCLNENEAASCPSHQTWDENLCKCKCPNVYGCFEDEFFSNTTCRCEFRQHSNIEQPDVTPDVNFNPCENADPPVRCRPPMTPVPFGDVCECRITNNWGDDLASIDVIPDEGSIRVPIPPINLRPVPTRNFDLERVPGHPMYQEVPEQRVTRPQRPARPTRPSRPSRRRRPRE